MFYFLVFIAVVGVGILVLLGFIQEKIIFFPTTLPSDYTYDFKQEFEEVDVKTIDGVRLNALLFHADVDKTNASPSGVIFYLHGNAGSLKDWGNVSEVYTKIGYDLFIMDYRGYGKSEGQIKNEKQFYDDVKLMYARLLSIYEENDVVIIGNSIGTGVAARLASENKCKLLVLQAPYYNFASLVQEKLIYIPNFVLNYQFKTNEYLTKCNMPVYLFHGQDDRVIHVENSKRLSAMLNEPDDRVFLLDNQGHNGMNYNMEYLEIIKNY